MNVVRTPNAELPEVREFMEMHLGMFVHWGLYCVPAGVWKGQALEQWQLGEGIMFYMRIPLAEYREFTAEFRPSPDWAENLVRSAKEAGMRYIVITAKHHDGFCLFRSQHNDYNARDQIGRDLIEELAETCRAQDMRLGFYYSHTLDWSEPDARGNRSASGYKTERGNTWDFPDETAKDYSRFLHGKVFTQVRELLTQYGILRCQPAGQRRPHARRKPDARDHEHPEYHGSMGVGEPGSRLQNSLQSLPDDLRLGPHRPERKRSLPVHE